MCQPAGEDSRLDEAEKEVFEGHAAHLPGLAIFFLGFHAALALVVEVQSDFEELVSAVIEDQDGVIFQLEAYCPAEVFGHEDDGKKVGLFFNHELVGGVFGADGVAGADVLADVGTEGRKDCGQGAGRARCDPGKARLIQLFVVAHNSSIDVAGLGQGWLDPPQQGGGIRLAHHPEVRAIAGMFS